MNEIKIFQNKEFGEVRSLVIDGEPWLVGKDVAKALGYNNPTKAIRDHVDEEDKKMGVQNVTPYIIDSLGRKQYPSFINESGVYSLIFGSKLPSAKKFKHWVTSEVLPTLRKTGRYEIPNDPMGALKLMFEAQTQTNEKVEKQEQRITKLEENSYLTPGQYNYLSKAVQRKVARVKKRIRLGVTSKTKFSIISFNQS